MKKIIIPLALCLFNISLVHAQFGTDTKTWDRPAIEEGPISMDVAFNGWIYEAFSIYNGFVLVKSTDNGATWATVDTARLAGYRYTVRIALAGNDTSNLRVHMAVNRYESATGTSILYVNVYDAVHNHFLGNTIIDSYASDTRGFDIATDTKFPSVASTGYSVGVLYIVPAGRDSLLLAVATNADTMLYNPSKLVATTNQFFINATMAYGISSSHPGGGFYMAWEQVPTIDTNAGHIFTAYTPNNITAQPTAPCNIDSISTNYIGRLGNPRMSASQSVTINNDSSNVTAVLLANYTGQGQSNNVITRFANFKAATTNHWSDAPINRASESCLQADISFDPGANNFLITYYNETTRQLQYLTDDFNLADSFKIIYQNYADDPTLVVSPSPQVRVIPTTGKPALGFTNTYGSTDQAMFNGPAPIPAPVITSLSPNQIYTGSGNFVLTVNGTGFQNNSYITWNTDSLATTFVSSTQLVTTIPADFVDTAGTAPIRVITPPDTGNLLYSNTAAFHVLLPSSINRTDEMNNIAIYPNPACNQLNVAYSFNQPGEMDIRLYDVTGRPVTEAKHVDSPAGNGIISEDVSNLSQGIYQLIINTGTEILASKITVVR